MKFKMKTTVEVRHDTPAGKLEHPKDDSGPLAPFALRERKSGTFAHYRLVEGNTYDWTKERAEKLIAAGHAE